MQRIKQQLLLTKQPFPYKEYKTYVWTQGDGQTTISQ